MSQPKRVFIASPHRADTYERFKAQEAYLKECVRDSFERDEAPFAPHAFYPFVLDDRIPHEREQAMEAGASWLGASDLLAVYEDMGISEGMERELDWARSFGVPIEYRRIGDKGPAETSPAKPVPLLPAAQKLADILWFSLAPVAA